jgi:hypothetical protein|tara:strand:- start:959 stop:1246 length:288 start_codon:yes stop_codon:yes gene_type:complete
MDLTQKQTILMLNPFFKYVVSIYFLPLFIMARTATIKIMTTRANSPIIQIPFSQATKGIFSVFKMYWFLFESNLIGKTPSKHDIPQVSSFPISSS